MAMCVCVGGVAHHWLWSGSWRVSAVDHDLSARKKVRGALRPENVPGRGGCGRAPAPPYFGLLDALVKWTVFLISFREPSILLCTKKRS